MYFLERFGAITLPIYNTTMTLSPVSAQTAFMQTTTGTFDSDGSGRNRQQFPHSLRYRADVLEDSLTATRALLDSILAAVGTRARLYRRSISDNSVHSCVARLIGAPHEGVVENQRRWRTVSLEFQQLSPWRGAVRSGPWRFDQGIYLDDSYQLDSADLSIPLNSNPKVIQLPNLGNLPVTDVTVTVRVNTGSLTMVRIRQGEDIDWQYNGLVSAGQSLIVDCAAMAVLNNGVNGYSGFYRNAAHKRAEWLRLQPGWNNVYVSWAASEVVAARAQFEYADGWA